MDFTDIEVLGPLIIMLSSIIIFSTMLYKQMRTKYSSINWIILLFMLLSLLGLVELLHISVDIPATGTLTDVGDSGYLVSLPRLVNYIIFYVFYFILIDYFYQKLSISNLIVFTALNTLYLFLNFYLIASLDNITVGEALSINLDDDPPLAHLVFDLVQLYLISRLLVELFKIPRIVKDKSLKNDLTLLAIGVLLFLGATILEVLEHFNLVESLSAFVTSLPTFVLLAYFFVRHPDFVMIFMLNKSRSLIVKFKQSGDNKLIDHTKRILTRIIKVADKQELFSLYSTCLVLKSKIELLEGNIAAAYESLDHALDIAETNNSADKESIQSEIDELENNLSQWESLYKRSLKVKDRFNHTQIENYMNYVIENFSKG